MNVEKEACWTRVATGWWGRSALVGALRMSQLGPGFSKVQLCCSAVEDLKFVCKATRNVWLCDLMPRVSVGEASRVSRTDINRVNILRSLHPRSSLSNLV